MSLYHIIVPTVKAEGGGNVNKNRAGFAQSKTVQFDPISGAEDGNSFV